MKKLFAKITAIISAATMFAVPALSANASYNPRYNRSAKNYYDGDGFYHRIVWESGYGIGGHRDILVGDANGDNKVNIDDATAIMKHITNPDNCRITDRERLIAADANGEGGVTMMDALLIQKVVYGITTFEEGQTQFEDIDISTGTYRVCTEATSTVLETVLVGDVNNDGAVTIADVTAINQINGNYTNTRDKRAADINNDGKVNQIDKNYLYAIDAGRRTNFDDLY